MNDGCEQVFEIDVLRGLIRGSQLEQMLRRAQAAELREAGLDAEMDQCPFCDFAMIIENREERVFRCQNPDCLRESCR